MSSFCGAESCNQGFTHTKQTLKWVTSPVQEAYFKSMERGIIWTLGLERVECLWLDQGTVPSLWVHSCTLCGKNVSSLKKQVDKQRLKALPHRVLVHNEHLEPKNTKCSKLATFKHQLVMAEEEEKKYLVSCPKLFLKNHENYFQAMCIRYLQNKNEFHI